MLAPSSIAIAGGPQWMEALAAPELRQPTVAGLIAQPGPVMLAELSPSYAVGDWADWIARMQRLEQEWFAPLLAALKDGRIGGVKLFLSHRNGWIEASTSKLAQYQFWRTPNLNSLLKQS